MNGAAYDVAIVGGGQAGLIACYNLQRSSPELSIVVLDRNKRIGDAWRNRYDSLTLFSPGAFTLLPGMPPINNDAEGFATKDEMADYVETFAAKNNIIVNLDEEVRSIRRKPVLFNENADLIIATSRQEYHVRAIIIATGTHMRARRPPFAARVPSSILAMHSSEYKNASQLPPGPVLVCGCGASGVAIATEVQAAGHLTTLCGRDPGALPRRVFGRDIYWWLYQTGMLAIDRHSFMGSKIFSSSWGKGDQLVGSALGDATGAGVIHHTERVADINEQGAFVLDNGRRVGGFTTVIYATGFQPHYGFLEQLDPELCDEDGYPKHHLGVSPRIPGLFFVGLKWQSHSNSGLLQGMPSDCEYIATQVAAFLERLRMTQPRRGTLALTPADARRRPVSDEVSPITAAAAAPVASTSSAASQLGLPEMALPTGPPTTPDRRAHTAATKRRLFTDEPAPIDTPSPRMGAAVVETPSMSPLLAAASPQMNGVVPVL